MHYLTSDFDIKRRAKDTVLAQTHHLIMVNISAKLFPNHPITDKVNECGGKYHFFTFAQSDIESKVKAKVLCTTYRNILANICVELF